MPKLSWTLSARATELDPHRDLSPYGLRARASVQVPGTGGADSAPIGKCATMWFFRDRRRALPSSYEVMRPSASGIAPRDRSKAGQAEAVSSGQGQRDVPDIRAPAPSLTFSMFRATICQRARSPPIGAKNDAQGHPYPFAFSFARRRLTSLPFTKPPTLRTRPPTPLVRTENAASLAKYFTRGHTGTRRPVMPICSR